MIVCAPVPITEQERLAALRALGVLDTPPERAFDDLTRLAAQICGVPIAAITLVDECRQWFKSIVGLDAPETSREASFCAHTILQPDVMVVPDAQADSRFSDNPLVTGTPHIRFYAGTPLVMPEGHTIGSLCVIDRVPRTLTSDQQSALAALGRQVADQLTLRRAVAERALAQAQLREYAERFETAVEAMQEGLVVQDAGGVIQVCNAAAERILGLPADQMKGRSSLDPCWYAIHADGSDFPGEEHPATLALRAGITQKDVLMGVHRPGGDLVWVSVNAAPMFLPGETTPHAVVVTFADVTERRQAELVRDRLAAIVDSSHDAILGATLEGILVSWNAGAERLYGYSEAEMIGKNASVLPGRGEESPVPAAVHALLRGEAVVPVEVARRRKDGARIDVRLTFSPIHDALGEMVGIGAIARDITAQKEAEAALLRERQLLNALLESLNEGIVACEAEGTLVFFNRAAREFCGLPEGPLIPDRLADHFTMYRSDGVTPLSTEDSPRFRALRGEIVRDFEMVIAPKKGVPRTLLANSQAIQDDQGRKLGAVIAMHDITARKTMAEALREREARLRAVLESAPVILYAADAQGTVTLSEGTGLAALGLKPGEAVGRSVYEFSGGNPEIEANTRRALAGEAVSYDARYGKLCLHTEMRPLRNTDGRAAGLIGVCFDVTERAVAAERFRVLFEHSSDAHLIFNEAGIMDCNEAAVALLGCTEKAEVLSRHPAVFSPEFQPDGKRSMEKCLEMDAVAWRDGFHRFEWVHRRVDGEEIPVEVTLTPVTLNERPVMLVVWHDLTERKRAEQYTRDYAVVLEFQKNELEKANAELERLAATDGLTGLKNNRAFQERLAEEFRRASRYHQPLSLLLLDVDNFKQFNDSFGHPAGDAVLQQVAEVLRQTARETDLAARYGGEEFVVVLPQTDGDGALVIAERLRAAVAAAPWDLRAVTVSVGVATVSLDTPDPETLIVCADDALYRSKAAGRDRVTHHRQLTASRTAA